MKKFLFKISLYGIGILGVLLFLGSYADGNTDDNYRHFTGPPPDNMILGDSRGVQAVVPDVLDRKFKDRQFINFAFNIGDSPYGKVYLEAIKKKIAPDTKNGIFILTVDPWCLSVDEEWDSENGDPDKNSPLADMHFFNMTPNYEYLIKHYPRSWFNIVKERESVVRSNTFLHKNGWMEVTVDINQDSIRKREIKKVEGYRAMIDKQKISPFRLNALQEIIEYLNQRGKVYIVRIPAFKGMMAIENQYSPEFSILIRDIARQHNAVFFDFSSKQEDYIYTDGNHMYKESGKIFTAQIADSILSKKGKSK
ncbi:hypothetical protein [uncultured Chryseobacterium sp.]|uniref:hypothetical protein n=1 Tax=uncultured Chryseobacterium sp. TaxID=259322 RepID=UPI0025D0229E|nr:hypothetical protein [uncultured Chryseobacterium sp.]